MRQKRPRIPVLPATLLASAFVLAASPAALGETARVPNACSVRTINGSYAFYRTGSTAVGPLAALGIATYDGKGHATGSQSISRNGEYEFDNPIDFFYEVNDDCTGRGLTPEGDEFFRLVAADDGKTIYFFSESEGNAIYGVATRIHAPAPKPSHDH